MGDQYFTTQHYDTHITLLQTTMNDVPTRQQVYNKTWNVERIQWLHFTT